GFSARVSHRFRCWGERGIAGSGGRACACAWPRIQISAAVRAAYRFSADAAIRKRRPYIARGGAPPLSDRDACDDAIGKRASRVSPFFRLERHDARFRLSGCAAGETRPLGIHERRSPKSPQTETPARAAARAGGRCVPRALLLRGPALGGAGAGV